MFVVAIDTKHDLREVLKNNTDLVFMEKQDLFVDMAIFVGCHLPYIPLYLTKHLHISSLLCIGFGT